MVNPIVYISLRKIYDNIGRCSIDITILIGILNQISTLKSIDVTLTNIN